MDSIINEKLDVEHLLIKKISPRLNSCCVQEIKIIARQGRKKSNWVNIETYHWVYFQITMLCSRVYRTWEEIEGILVKNIEKSIGSRS